MTEPQLTRIKAQRIRQPNHRIEGRPRVRIPFEFADDGLRHAGFRFELFLGEFRLLARVSEVNGIHDEDANPIRLFCQ